MKFLFYFHIFAFANFLLLYLYNFYNIFVKTNRNTGLVKVKMTLILFTWTLFGALGVLIFVPREWVFNQVEGDKCGMFWLVDLGTLIILPFLEIAFLMLGVVFVFILKNKNYSNEPVSIFNNKL